jgi:hypothetical protein
VFYLFLYLGLAAIIIESVAQIRIYEFFFFFIISLPRVEI